MTPDERRQHARMPLSLPVRTEGHNPDGSAWVEMATSRDASMGGVSVSLQHSVRVGQVLHMSLPLPKRFRPSHIGEAAYRVYALVRSVTPGGQVGVVFLGQEPPRGYRENKAGLFGLPEDIHPPAHAERRRDRRREGLFFVVLKRMEGGESSREYQEEATLADNLGRRGAQVMISLPFSRGEVVWVEEAGGSFRTRAEIRNVYVGQDNIARANLLFLDGETPERMLNPGS